MNNKIIPADVLFRTATRLTSCATTFHAFRASIPNDVLFADVLDGACNLLDTVIEDFLAGVAAAADFTRGETAT